MIRIYHIFLITTALALLPVNRTWAGSALTQWVNVDAGRAQAARTQPFTLTYKTKKWTVPASQVQMWFKVKTTDNQTMLQLRPSAIYNYLNVYIAPTINDVGENSMFVRIDGNVHLVQGGRKGSIVDGEKVSLAFRSAIVRGQKTAPISMKQYRPRVFSAQDFSVLLFPDRLSRGETNFAGSPPNRVHNIKVATARFNGLVVMPGEEFSFNQYLGDVDAKNGYLPELVIKKNTTTPEYGGGICQVATTAFRAALQAGLDITSRRNHSYPVRYYGAPGYDATVYAPVTDLRFLNDTGYPITIVTVVEGTKVVFDVWGTRGGRSVKVNGPFITARGSDGSITAAIAQYVYEGGKTVREENFVSVYQSPDKFPEVRKANQG